MAGWNRRPIPENLADSWYNYGHPTGEYGTRRNAPAEEPFRVWGDLGKGWHGWTDRGRHLRNFKPRHHWARPVDGARRGTLGRLKDGLTGRGPDVFVVSAGDRRTLMREMPRRSQWSNWESINPAIFNENNNAAFEDRDWFSSKEGRAPWVHRPERKVYNFRTRRYENWTESRAPRMWSDASWEQNVRGRYRAPNNVRNGFGVWYPTWVSPNAGRWAGGRPR